MNCKFINNIIEQGESVNTLSLVEQQKLQEHLDVCALCHQTYNEHLAYLSVINKLEMPDLNTFKAKEILQRASQVNKKATNDSTFWKGFIAASVLSVALLGSWQLSQESESTLIAQHNTVKSTTTEVTLVINSPEDISDADLNLLLPEYVSVAYQGYENEKDLFWAVDLKKGVNTITLPIKINNRHVLGEPLSIMATIYHEAEEREFEIKLNLSDNSDSENSALFINQQMNKTV